MSDNMRIDPEVTAQLASAPAARCRVIITLAEENSDGGLVVLELADAAEIEGLPGLIRAELDAAALERLKKLDDVQAIEIDSEQTALA